VKATKSLVERFSSNVSVASPDTMAADWIGYRVAINCGSVLGTFRGVIARVEASDQSITLRNVDRNGEPCTSREITIKSALFFALARCSRCKIEPFTELETSRTWRFYRGPLSWNNHRRRQFLCPRPTAPFNQPTLAMLICRTCLLFAGTTLDPDLVPVVIIMVLSLVTSFVDLNLDLCSKQFLTIYGTK